jgi:hypothetical protein
MTKLSLIKIYGPPVLKSIRALEKIAIDMPEVCIMDTVISDYTADFLDPDYTSNYFSMIPASIEVERCDTIISKSGEKLGEYDFFFEWFKDPTMDELNNLIEKIDEALAPIGSRYTITSK